MNWRAKKNPIETAYVLETERLALRHFSLQDDRFLFELLNDPNWIKYIGDRGIKSRRNARDYIRKILLKRYQELGYTLYLVERRDDNTFLGMCGLVKRDFLPYPDVGYALLSKFVGNGYALEACRAVLQYSQDQLQLSTVAAITLNDNIRSVRLLANLGFKYQGQIPTEESEEHLALYYCQLD